MLRIVNHMVDGYLDLRRELTHQLDHWQSELLNPRTRFNNWGSLLDARLSLHQLDEICEDQRAAMQDWIDSLETLPVPKGEAEQRERELIMIRSRDVLEHIERVVHHVHRLEQNAETAVQMHFSVQGHRANDIMRVLTVLTAVFLPSGHSADGLRKTILEASNMSLGNGLGILADKVFRIGHLGDFHDLMVTGTLSGVEMGLAAAGIPHQAGGVQVAMAYLQGNKGAIAAAAE
eukprot:gene45591-60935_t